MCCHFATMDRIQQSVCVLLQIFWFSAHGSMANPATTQNSAGTPYGPVNLTITGPEAVTVGVPCSFICLAQCSPECSYTMSINGQSVQGNEIAFIPNQWVSYQNVSCKATNKATGHTSTEVKPLQTLEGPVNVYISGPTTLSPGKMQKFQCTAFCVPSCIYTWTVDGGEISSYGNDLTMRSSSTATSATIICKATNSVSRLFASAVQKLHLTTNLNGMAMRMEALPAVVLACMISSFLSSIMAP